MTELITVEDFAARYQCERHYAAKLMKKSLPVIRVGKRMFVKATDLMEWERKRTDYPVREAARCSTTYARR